MFRRLLLCTAALVASAATLGAHAHDGPLDPRFGDGGMRSYGYPPVDGSSRDDRASVACPRPDGTLVVTGAASNGRRIVTLRLLPNGNYDPAFGGGTGRVAFELAMSFEPQMTGLCLPDGKILLARRLRIDASGEMNIQLIRIDTNTGLPDPTFDDDGVALLDLDGWQSGLGLTESPHGLSLLDNGEVLLTGRTSHANAAVAFAARILPDGSIPVARIFIDVAERATANVLMTATLGSDGTIWTIAEGKQPGSTRVTPYRVRLNRINLAWIDVPDPLPGATGPDIYAGRGVRVRSDVLAVPLIERVPGTNPQRFTAGLMIYRATGKVFLPLPPPSLTGESPTLSEVYFSLAATLLPGGRVLYAGAVQRPGESVDRGMHLAVVRVGEKAGDDALETRFGNGGAQTAAFRPSGAACTETLVGQEYATGTVWNGVPTLVGYADADCGGDTDIDYVVARIRTDDIFADGFD